MKMGIPPYPFLFKILGDEDHPCIGGWDLEMIIYIKYVPQKPKTDGTTCFLFLNQKGKNMGGNFLVAPFV